jgi:hypothetical protein
MLTLENIHIASCLALHGWIMEEERCDDFVFHDKYSIETRFEIA